MKKNKPDIINEEPIPVSENDSPKNKKKARRAVIILICIMAVLGIVSLILLHLEPKLTESEAASSDKDSVGMYGSGQSYIYYPADEDIDPSALNDYLGLDRGIYYTHGAETVVIDEDKTDNLSDDVKFFIKYFTAVKDGDYTAYNSMFTEDYYKTNEPYYSFTKQMLYDINIEKLSEDTSGADTVYEYNVSYKIFRNNGTFRNDIGSDGSKTLYFQLISDGENILINKIDYYV